MGAERASSRRTVAPEGLDIRATAVFAPVVEARLEQMLSEHTGTRASVLRLEALPGGACQDNFLVELELAAGPLAGKHKMVLRSDAPTSLPGSLDRKDEYAVIRAAVDAGVQTPEARWLLKDLVRDGSHAYLLDWVPGIAIGRKIVSAPELAAAREGLASELAIQLAKIHRIEPDSQPDLIPNRVGWSQGEPGGSPVDNTLRSLRAMFDAMPEPHPALELALAWLRENIPAAGRLVLVHGDFRTGNFMLTPDGLTGILDWEFSHWGAPEEDLAWISVRDWRFGRLDRPIGGFADREPFYAAYEEASGHPVDRSAVHFWEVWGNVHWAAGCVYQGERYFAGEQRDLELIAIARRAAEMELEALRLIDKGVR